MSDEVTTLGIRVALKLGNCAHLSGGMALGQIPGS
jgi:hypothetical protein